MAKIGKVQEVAVNELVPYEKNAKLHGEDQIEKLKASILEFGFLTPCLIDKKKNIIAGHGRVMAAKALGMETVPCVFIEGLTEAQRKAYILADNRLGELGEWDIVKAITNSSKKGDVVLDLFGGSDTTLIACEQTGRKCRMSELDPHYCDVIIQRWENLTGKKAKLVE